jgi:hypothetical protein
MLHTTHLQHERHGSTIRIETHVFCHDSTIREDDLSGTFQLSTQYGNLFHSSVIFRAVRMCFELSVKSILKRKQQFIRCLDTMQVLTKGCLDTVQVLTTGCLDTVQAIAQSCIVQCLCGLVVRVPGC